ncbi:MAG: transposase [Saprospiraceae bacterium]|nr:transposase [Saprospiraceae bacterium]
MQKIELKNIYFTTSTILGWTEIMVEKKMIDIILNTWKFLVDEQRIKVYAFVIMSNHIHWLYEVLPPFKNDNITHSFLSYTAKLILNELGAEKEYFLINKVDRKYQLWKTNSLSVDIYSTKFLYQKMNYIHKNPVSAGYGTKPEDYIYSSSGSYKNGISEFDFLTLYGR